MRDERLSEVANTLDVETGTYVRTHEEQISVCTLCNHSDLATVCASSCLSRCNFCGLIFVNPRPSLEAVIAHYEQHAQYSSWIMEERARDNLWKRRLRLVMREVTSGDLLDVGAGIGQFLHVARDSFRVEGTEMSRAAAAISMHRYGIPLRIGALEHLDFDRKFDVITAFHVLEHVFEPGSFLRRCVELLKPGGVLIIAVPNEVDAMASRVYRLRCILSGTYSPVLGKLGIPRLCLRPQSEVHVSHFTGAVLNRALQAAGLAVTRHTLDPAFPSAGLPGVRKMIRFLCHLTFYSIFRTNIYTTTWIVGRRGEADEPTRQPERREAPASGELRERGKS